MRRVLVVDDNAVARTRVAEDLRRAGFRVDEFGTARDSLAALASGEFDAVIAELLLPDLHGIAFVRLCSERLPHAKFFLTSTFDLSRRQLERMGLGAVGFILKSEHGECAVRSLCAAWSVSPGWLAA